MFEESNKDTCILYCDSGCIDGVILKVDRDDCDCCLSLVSDNYFVMQQSGWERFKEKCKRIWRIIANKEYRYFDIFIGDDDLKNFKNFVASIKEKNDI